MARVSDGENNPEKVITVNYVASIILAELSIKYGLEIDGIHIIKPSTGCCIGGWYWKIFD